MIVKSFTTYLKESKTEKNSLTKIASYIKKRFKKPNILYSYWVGKLLDYKKFLVVSKIETSTDVKDIKYAYLKVGTDKYFDSVNFLTKDDIIEKYNISTSTFKDFTYLTSFDKIEKHLENNDKMNDKIINEIKHLIEKLSE